MIIVIIEEKDEFQLFYVLRYIYIYFDLYICWNIRI